MGKTRFKIGRLFLKLLLFFLVYSHHKIKAEAKENSTIIETFDGIEPDDGRGPGSNDQMFEKEKENNVFNRQKRPYRLLPLTMIFEKDKNRTDGSENPTNERFYGPATTCKELLKIGHTRNGFYLVKGNDTSNSGNVEVVDCLFKNAHGIKEINETRLGFVPLKNAEKLHKRRSTDAFKVSQISSGLAYRQTRQLLGARKKIARKRHEKGTKKAQKVGSVQTRVIPNRALPQIKIDENRFERSKRPARLLPFRLLHEGDENLTKEKHSSKTLYGPPTNCMELEKIGYTLNGYYLVSGSGNSYQVEVVLCRFKLPPGNTENVGSKEERLGFISLEQSRVVKKQLPSYETTLLERKIRPFRLLPISQKSPEKLIYNNPANCGDMGKLGYTLNGFYLVNDSDTVGRLGVAYCQFQLPQWADRTAKEEASGFFNLTEMNITNTTTTLTKDESADFLKNYNADPFKNYNFDFFKNYNADFLKNYNGGFSYKNHYGGKSGYHMTGNKHGYSGYHMPGKKYGSRYG